MEAPEQITAETAGDYLEVLTKAVFQAGISWRVIAAKWDGFREAFDGFDAEKVANLTPKDVDRLVEDTRIRSHRTTSGWPPTAPRCERGPRRGSRKPRSAP
jgi:3-methyladenine DNA glycosylase Tag